MEKDVAVSIIIPLYNRRKTIRRCLDSLISQTLENIEIVVVDDGSTDHGDEIVREYQEKDDRVRLVFQENKGPGAARNTGIHASTGKYLGFVDSDDYVEKNMYAVMLEAVQAENAEVAVCQEKHICHLENGTAKLLGETAFPCEKPRVFEKNQVIEWILNYTYLSLNSVCYKLVRRDVFFEKNVWFPENYRYAEDLTASVGIFSVVKNVVVVPESLYCYVHETTGTMSTNYTIKKAQDVYQDMLESIKYLKKAGYKGRIDNFVLGMKFSSLRQLYGAERKEERTGKDSIILRKRWKKLRRKVRPVFSGKEIPVMHKIKILASYLNLEYLICTIFQLLGRIPFFKYMV